MQAISSYFEYLQYFLPCNFEEDQKGALGIGKVRGPFKGNVTLGSRPVFRDFWSALWNLIIGAE